MGCAGLNIVCYTGGTAGDLVVAIIDPKDVEINEYVIRHNADRSRLKKPHLFDNDSEKNQYLKNISLMYNSVPSHDLNFHQRQGHDFISVIVQNKHTARWAANRFKKLHRPWVWQEMCRHCNAVTIDDYAQVMIDYSNMVKTIAKYTVNLEDIIQGQAITCIENILQRKLLEESKQIYQTWISKQCFELDYD